MLNGDENENDKNKIKWANCAAHCFVHFFPFVVAQLQHKTY